MATTAKGKAEQLFKKFLTTVVEEMEGQAEYTAKQCAIIHVEQIIQEILAYFSESVTRSERYIFWSEVLRQLQNRKIK